MSDTIPLLPGLSEALKGSRSASTLPLLPGLAEAESTIRAASTFQGLPVQPWEYDQITRSVDGAKDPEDEMWKWANAIQFSRLYGKPLADTYQNIEAYNTAFLGESVAPKTAAKAIADSLSLGVITQKMNDLGNQIMLGGGDDPEAFAEYQDFKKRSFALADNVENRSLLVQGLEAGMQSVPYMVQSSVLGAVAVGTGVAVTTLSGGTLSGLAIAALYKTGSFLGSAAGVSGLEYMRMRENGVDHDVASALAVVSATLQGGIEVALGADAAVAGLFGKGSLGAISSKISQKIVTSGLWPTIAARTATRMAGVTFEEGLEEGIQQAVSATVDYASAEAMKARGVKINRDSFSKVLTDVLENAKQGALAAPFFGGMVAPFQTRIDYQTLKGMEEFAKTVDRPTFKAEVQSNPKTAEIIEGIKEEERGPALDRMWDQAQKKAAEGGARPEANIVRMPSGALHTSETSIERANGAVDATLMAGNPKTGERYAALNYEISPEQGTPKILLRDIKATPGVGLELMVKLGAQYPGISIETDELSTPAAKALAEQASGGNPNGPQAGAQWFPAAPKEDERAKSYMRARLVDAFGENADAGQIEVGIAMHQARALAEGVSFQDYLSKTFTEGIIKRGDTEIGQQAAEAGTIGRSMVEFQTPEGQVVPFDQINKDARALVYISGTSTIRSFLHESGHIWRRQTAGTELGARLEGIYGVKNGVWSRAQEERYASDLESWMMYGEARSEEMKGILWQVARWFKSIFEALKLSKTPISPEIDQAMADLFKTSESPLSNIAGMQEAEAKITPVEAVAGQEGAIQPKVEPERLAPSLISENEKILGPNRAGMLDAETFPPENVPVDQITMSSELPQFKRNARTETGVVEPLPGDKFIRLPLRPIVLWRRTSGALELVTGRHRLDLARRLGEKDIPAQIIPEDEVHNLAWASTFDAESNILDNQGDVDDYVSYFRRSDISAEEASKRGLLRTDKGRQGFTIGRYASETLLSLYRDDRISSAKAAAIAEGAPNDEAAQAAAIAQARDLSPPELNALARKNHPETTGTVLFEPGDLTAGSRLEEKILAQYGETQEPKEAGFILSDGRMVASRGKVIPNAEDFMVKTGALRVDFVRRTAYSLGMPSQAQIELLVAQGKDDLWIYFDSENGELLGQKAITSPTKEKIEEFFQNPTAPQIFALFESVEEVSTSLQDELYARDIPYQVKFSRLSSTRYYSFAGPDRNYTIRVADHQENRGSARWHRVDLSVIVKSKESVANLLRWLDETLGPAKFRGASEFSKGTNGTGDEVLFEGGEEGLASPNNPFRKNRGKFADFIERDDNLDMFLAKLWGTMEKEYDPAQKKQKRGAVERRLSSHPFVLGAVYKMGRGQKLSVTERRNILSSIRRNELAFKEMFSEVTGNLDLKHEVKRERAAIVGPKDIKAPKMKGYLEMTVAERTAILSKIRDKAVRDRIDSGEITDDEILAYIERLNADRRKLRTSRKEVAQGAIREEALGEALDSARKEARMNTRLVVAELRAMQRLRAERDRLVTRIMTPSPPTGMEYSYKTMVQYIQEYLRAKRWITQKTEAGGHIFTGEVYEPQNLATMLSKFFKDNPGMEEILREQVVNRINDKPMSSWSNVELKELLDILDSFKMMGRLAYQAKKNARLQADAITRNSIDSWIRGMKHFIPPNVVGSIEEKKALRDLDRAHLINFNTMNMDRFSQYFLDHGNKSKTNFELLVHEERMHRRNKYTQVERRINRIVKELKKRDLKPQDLYRKILVKGAGPGQMDATFTAWSLMFASAAMRNNYSYEAFVYGNLFDQTERESNTDKELIVMAKPRIEAVNTAIAKYLTDQERQIVEELLKDSNDEFDRVNQAAIEMTEQELKKEENYVLMQRIGIMKSYTSEDPTSREVIEELFSRNGISFSAGPAKGHTIERIVISPKHQTPINTDYWEVFLNSVEKQEHLIEYGRYHQKLRSIYLDGHRAKSIQESLLHYVGKSGVEYLKRYIGEIANPISYKDRDYSEALIRKVRGGVSIGYLAWRWVSVANQLATSPLPYLAYAPAHMLGSAGQLISNPMRFIEEVEGMSVMLRHRQIDPIYERIKNLDREGWEGVTRVIGEKGMLGLTFSDRWSVALGWKAVYDKHFAQTKDHEASVIFADDITLKSQPSAYGADLSPLFRDNNEWKRIVTQFGTQLNVIWQQLRYDTVIASREKRYGELIGIMMATALGGIALGIIRKLRGKDEPPEDPEKWWVDWAYYTFSQGFNSVPLIGGELAASAKRIMTGEFTWQENDNFPAIMAILSASERISKLEGKTGQELSDAQWKIFNDALESGMMFVGLPALAARETIDLGKTIVEGGNGD